MSARLVEMIGKESVRLNGLVQSILDLARLEREGDVLRPVETDLGELVRETVENFRPQAAAKGIALAVSVPDGSGSVKIDAQLVSQALSNLIANAIRHSGSKDVSVSAESDAGQVRIAVEDHGIGVPAEHRARIFERFHRVDEARAAETGGAGLGLSIVRQIVRLHGGEVTLKPVTPSGCRFVMSFPSSK